MYLHHKSDLTIKCNKGHIWISKAQYLRNGSWCHECGYEVNDYRKQKISEGITKFLASSKGKENKTESHKKRSITMTEQREKIRESITEKECKKCNNTKLISSFNKKSDTKDGYQPYCKECINIIKRYKKN